jgi:hypothetical protein
VADNELIVTPRHHSYPASWLVAYTPPIPLKVVHGVHLSFEAHYLLLTSQSNTESIQIFKAHINQIPTSKMSQGTMKAVVFKGKLDVKIEDRPIPKIIDPTDIIVKVKYSALCGR